MSRNVSDEEETYIVQVYANALVPRAMNPVILRVSVGDTVGKMIEKALKRITEFDSLIVLPSQGPSDYTVTPATASGASMRAATPLGLDEILRDCGLEFPYMLCLEYAQEDGSTERVSPSQRNAQESSAATTKQALEIEKDAHERLVKELTAKREANVQQIEKKRAEKEKQHFHHCESYEIMRRERVTKEREVHTQKATVDEALREKEKIEGELFDERTQEQSKSGLQEHRRRIDERLEAERKEIAEMQHAREVKERKAAEAKQKAAEDLRIQREKDRTARMEKQLGELLHKLDEELLIDGRSADQRMEKEVAERRQTEWAQRELRKVTTLEHQRAVVKEAERRNRSRAAQIEWEAARLKELEQKERARSSVLDEEQRYRNWLESRQPMIEEIQSALELEYRAQDGVQ